MMNKLPGLSVVITVLFFMSCEKEEVSPIGAYTGQFWGVDYVTPYHKLNVPLEMTENNENSIVFNGDIILSKLKDSVQGVFIFEDEDYLMDPYLVGTWRQQDDYFVIRGHYAAVKDQSTIIKGLFEIQKDQ